MGERQTRGALVDHGSWPMCRQRDGNMQKRLGLQQWRWALASGLGVAVLLAVAGCQSLGYYAQSVGGHVALMNAAKPVDDWLADPATPPPLHARLQLAQQIRDYASRELLLPDNASYRSHADLQRRAAVWNVAAAPADSLALKTWCFVVLGCVSYRGYFDEAEAQALGQRLRDEGWEVDVYPVPAYSTLGWLNWLGGDPLLSTFIGYPEGNLAGLLFHELAHQQLYIDDDSAFNESFATAVEQLGVRQWLQTRPVAVQQAHEQGQQHREAFRALQRDTRAQLADLYAQRAQLTPAAMQAGKAQAMQAFADAHAALKASWASRGEPDARYDAWVAKANNASFGMQAVYQGWVPAFQRLFVEAGCDWARFYAEAHTLAQRPRAERDAALQALQQANANAGAGAGQNASEGGDLEGRAGRSQGQGSSKETRAATGPEGACAA